MVKFWILEGLSQSHLNKIVYMLLIYKNHCTTYRDNVLV